MGKLTLLSLIKRVNAFLLFCGVLVVTGCATVEGLGEDIESAGDAVEDAAEDAS